MDLSRAFNDNWQHKQFPVRQQRLLLAASGGIDSMVLASLLYASGFNFIVAHCNFQLRGMESDEDERLVSEWARQHGVIFRQVRFETRATAATWKKSIQETARDLRYEWLERIRKEEGCAAILTAHQANDNAETLLINLFRGTGISGLHGIPERNGKIIRPLLFASREAIRQFAEENGIPFREDSSNASDKYLRNAVRLNILPVVEQHFPGVVERLNEGIDRFSQAEQLYRKEADRQLRKLKQQRGPDVYIPVRLLEKLPARDALCYELFQEYGFSSAQMPQLTELAGSESGRYLTSDTHRVIKDRDFLIITSLQGDQTEFLTIEQVPAELSAGLQTFRFTEAERPAVIPAEQSTAWIDAAQLRFPLILRRWRTGDYFYPLGMGMKKKKLSRYFIDQKIPAQEKERIWVLESDKRVVWVAGHRLDERFKIGPATRKVLKVELRMP